MELAFKSNLIFLSSPFNCNWPCSETSVHLCLFSKEWDAFKSAGNRILSLRQELLVVQNCKRQLVFCSYIVLSFHHLFKKIDLCFYKWGLRSLGKHFHNIWNKCQKQKCQTNFEEVVYTLVRRPPFTLLSEKGIWQYLEQRTKGKTTKNYEEGVYTCPRTSLESSVWRRLLQYLFHLFLD